MPAYKATIVNRPGVLLSVRRAETFPDGIQAAWGKLEEMVGSLRGRRFYGITVPEEGELAYYAGVEPRDPDEIAAFGLPTYEIQGGKFARVRLFDWEEYLDEIPSIFGFLMKNYPMQDHGPTIEYYRSQKELHLLVPLEGEFGRRDADEGD